MKRVVTEREESNNNEFYEAMPGTMERPVYREDPVVIERDADRTGLSAWAVLGLVVLAILVLLLLFGRGGILGPSTSRSVNIPTPTNNTGSGTTTR
jgi:hypothetical protein